MARKDKKGRNLHIGESQRTDGTYMYRYTDKRSGKRQTIYANDLPQLREKEKQIAREQEEELFIDSVTRKMTVNMLFEQYMQTKELADTTRVNYIDMWNHHARDDIGNMKVIQIRSSHIKVFYAKMSRAGYSHSTIKLLHSLLYPALEMAVDDDMIHKNPARNALSGDYGEAPKEKTVFTLEQQEKILSFIQESNVYNVYLPMIKVMLETGLRCGELIGLTWADVDLENRKLSINHQLIYKDVKDGNGCSFHITKPKTKAGIRCIPMTETVYQAFIQQQKLNLILERHSKEKIDGYGNFIFLAKTGKPLMPSAINNVIYNMIDAYNKEELKLSKKEHRKAVLLPKISAHNMRHMACTNMAKQGMNIKVLQYIMGHAHSDVTMDVYNHIADFSDVQQEIYRYEKMVAVFEYTKIEKLV